MVCYVFQVQISDETKIFDGKNEFVHFLQKVFDVLSSSEYFHTCVNNYIAHTKLGLTAYDVYPGSKTGWYDSNDSG